MATDIEKDDEIAQLKETIKIMEDVILEKDEALGVERFLFRKMAKELNTLKDEVKANNEKKCESCEFFQPLTRNGQFYRRCFYLGSINLTSCSNWEVKKKWKNYF